MTAIMLAATQREADEAAFNLGLNRWIWPEHSADLFGLGVWPSSIVYVEGWRKGTAQFTDLSKTLVWMSELYGLPEIEQPRTMTILAGPSHAAAAQAVLAQRRRIAATPIPSASIEPLTFIPTGRAKPRKWWQIWR